MLQQYNHGPLYIILVKFLLIFSFLQTGFSVTLQHLDDHEFTVNVDDVTECDHVLRVPGKGMPRRSGKGFGDLYLTFEVDFPDTLSEKQKIAIKNILGKDSHEEL